MLLAKQMPILQVFILNYSKLRIYLLIVSVKWVDEVRFSGLTLVWILKCYIWKSFSSKRGSGADRQDVFPALSCRSRAFWTSLSLNGLNSVFLRHAGATSERNSLQVTSTDILPFNVNCFVPVGNFGSLPRYQQPQNSIYTKRQ